MEYIAHIGSLGCYVFEKVNEVGNWHSVLANISTELQKIRGCSVVLTIIDPYFLNVKDCDAEEYANALIMMFKENGFRKIQIFSKKPGLLSNNKFKNALLQQKQIKFEFSTIPNDIHDRFWITNELTGVVVGTSLNGLGKKLSLVYQISGDDMTILHNELLDRNINCQPNLE